MVPSTHAGDRRPRGRKDVSRGLDAPAADSCAAGRVAAGRARRDRRPARSQRSRQDDVALDSLDAADARSGRRHGPRRGRAPRPDRRSPPAEHGERQRLVPLEPSATGDPRILRPPVRCVGSRAPTPGPARPVLRHRHHRGSLDQSRQADAINRTSAVSDDRRTARSSRSAGSGVARGSAEKRAA